MLNYCKYSGPIVCKNEREREILKSILNTEDLKLHICEHATYVITNSKGQKFPLSSLEFASKSPRGYYVRDMFTSGIVYLNKDNVEVICSKKEC